jgi:hypothetical protein
MESPENGGACFPPFPQTLEIEKADFHIPSAPGRDDEYNSSFKTRKDKNPASPTLRFLQAHPWIGKDWTSFISQDRVIDFDLAVMECGGGLWACGISAWSLWFEPTEAKT